MTKEEIAKVLMAPPKLDLKGAVEYLKGIQADGWMSKGIWENVATFKVASTWSSAKRVVNNVENPEMTGLRNAFYYGVHNSDRLNYHEIIAAMKLAGVKAWQATLKRGDKNYRAKRVNPEKLAERFYMNIHQDRDYNFMFTATFPKDEHRGWEAASTNWAQPEQIGVSGVFLDALLEKNAVATKLLSFGFQGFWVKGSTMVFRPLPKALALKDVRGRYVPHSLVGPALIARSGKRHHFVSGVAMDVVEYTKYLAKHQWDTEHVPFHELIKEGRPTLPIKTILQVRNVEQRRVLLELLNTDEDRNKFLEELDAKLIDGPTEMGNELYRVDIGLPKEWRRFSLETGDIPDLDLDAYQLKQWKKDPKVIMSSNDSRKNYAFMLKYKCPSTDRVYTKFVHPKYRSADEAQAASIHYTLKEYKALKLQA
jgi:hypothetical protein